MAMMTERMADYLKTYMGFPSSDEPKPQPKPRLRWRHKGDAWYAARPKENPLTFRGWVMVAQDGVFVSEERELFRVATCNI